MSDWIDAVSERAGVDSQETQRVLDRYRVIPTPSLPRPRRLLVQRIRFSGFKLIGGDSEEFQFDFEMGPGVWCVATDQDNLAGKSSVLHILLWCLRGRCHVQRDVRDWLRRVELVGSIDQEEFAVKFNVSDGSPDGELFLTKPQERIVARFHGGAEFEQVMDHFMLDRLGLTPTPFWQKRPGDDAGDPTDLSWPGYSQALFIPSGSHRAVLGDELMGGQPGKLLQVFIGLPWAHTQAVARVALQSRKQYLRNQERRHAEDARARASEIGEIEARLNSVRKALASMADEGQLLVDLDRALEDVQAAALRFDDQRERSVSAKAALRQAESAYTADRQRLLDLQESSLARRFFHGLDPKVCPRCDHVIEAQRREQETLQAACALCGSGLMDLDESGEVLTDAEERAQASEEAHRVAQEGYTAAQAEYENARAAYDLVREQVDALLARRQAFVRRRQLELEEARLDGMLAEPRRSIPVPTPATVTDQELLILTAAEAEAKRRMDESKAHFFEDLNVEILRLGRAFGMSLLERVELDAAARMRLVKGGSQTWFSDVSDGEQLRLKIALVIALLRLGQRSGIGRHPGLLLIDSPGAQEEADRDFTTEIEELYRVAGEMEHIQLVLASARASLLQDVLPPERMRVAPKGGKLW